MTTKQAFTTKNLIVGLSGPSSSGKTTLARLLRAVFNIPASPETNHNSISLFILHQDDFYKTDAEIPFVTTPISHRRVQDWDCVEALDVGLLEETLGFIRTKGHLPPQLESKEDRNEVAVVGVGDKGEGDGEGEESGAGVGRGVRVRDAEVEGHRRRIKDALASLGGRHYHEEQKQEQEQKHQYDIRICILDGFLLYPDPDLNTTTTNENENQNARRTLSSITALLDVKLFLRATRAQTRSRRLARPGYVTLDGFWVDPPGYVDEVVWPNYVREHAWMFERGDVDAGEVRVAEVEGRFGIRVAPGQRKRDGEVEGEGEVVGMSMSAFLDWAVGIVVDAAVCS